MESLYNRDLILLVAIWTVKAIAQHNFFCEGGRTWSQEGGTSPARGGPTSEARRPPHPPPENETLHTETAKSLTLQLYG